MFLQQLSLRDIYKLDSATFTHGIRPAMLAVFGDAVVLGEVILSVEMMNWVMHRRVKPLP